MNLIRLKIDNAHDPKWVWVYLIRRMRSLAGRLVERNKTGSHPFFIAFG